MFTFPVWRPDSQTSFFIAILIASATDYVGRVSPLITNSSIPDVGDYSMYINDESVNGWVDDWMHGEYEMVVSNENQWIDNEYCVGVTGCAGTWRPAVGSDNQAGFNVRACLPTSPWWFYQSVGRWPYVCLLGDQNIQCLRHRLRNFVNCFEVLHMEIARI